MASWRRQPKAGLVIRTSKAVFRYGLVLVLVGLVGLAALRVSDAATYAVNKEIEGGTVVGKAVTVTAAGASGSTAVKFGSVDPPGVLYWQDAPASPVGKAAPLQNWENSPWNIVSGTMGVIADPQKGKAVSFNVTGGSTSKQRVEGTIPYDPVIGRTQYVGFDLKLSNSAINGSSGWQDIMQLKSNNEGNPSFEIEVDDGNLYAMSNRLNKPNQKVFIGTAPRETWSRIVLKMHVTKGLDSKVAAWQDGRQTLQDLAWESHDNTGENNGSGGLIYSNTNGGYYKFGLYRGPNNNFAMNVRYANMKIGSTYEIVAQ